MFAKNVAIKCGCGGNGRRVGLRSRFSMSAGSIPVIRTKKKNLSNKAVIALSAGF